MEPNDEKTSLKKSILKRTGKSPTVKYQKKRSRIVKPYSNSLSRNEIMQKKTRSSPRFTVDDCFPVGSKTKSESANNIQAALLAKRKSSLRKRKRATEKVFHDAGKFH